MLKPMLVALFASFFTIIIVVNADFTLVWSDEFSGSTIDPNKWVYQIGHGAGWGNNELECYTNRSQNSFISNGNLIIQGLKESYFSPSDSYNCSYTSARMMTSTKFSTLFGRFEMRAKLPAGQGMWPAFWLLGDNIWVDGWPKCGEIDIMEYVGNDPTHVYGSTHGVKFNTGNPYENTKGFTNDYHIYTTDWEPNSVTFLVDNIPYRTVTTYEGKGNWPFNNQTMFITLNLAIGGNWPGSPNASTPWPAQYVIDYVRVYKSNCCTCA